MFENFSKPYFIAEIGVNHEGSLERAFEMIESVARAGADCAKFQTYKAETLAAQQSPAYWDQTKEPTSSQFNLFKKYDTFNQEDYQELKNKCDQVGVDFISTPFDTECLPWLMPMMDFVKIASADLTNFILIKEISKYKKPVVLSVGASSMEEIAESVDFLIDCGTPKIALLHCVLNYPTKPENAFLDRIRELEQLKSNFNVPISIGYSDHVPSNAANDDQVIASVALGARIIEKHFTFDKTLPGNDHYHAMDEADLSSLISRLTALSMMIAPINEDKLLSSQALATAHARRSLYFRRDLEKGHVLRAEDIIAKRPGHGVSPKQYSRFIGRTLNVNVHAEQQLSLDHFQ